MPILQRYGSVTVRMYADDHRPPHFHIVGPDFHVLVRISDLAVIAGGSPPDPDCRGVGMGTGSSGKLALKWAELNERG